MSKYFDNSHEWEEKDKEFLGLPRPYKVLTDSYIKKVKDRFSISKKIPIPWQSRPILDEISGLAFNVIKENESLVFKKSLCAYCGNKIQDYEKCVRWVVDDTINFIVNSGDGPRVFSDSVLSTWQGQDKAICPIVQVEGGMGLISQDG